ncbi:thioredoxin family protein [Lacrimispora sp. 38-1]|uniref:thioredoxin family protein n=1 Tax=Lacrimispora sp. 38-1 TaxID=3125778 RepID=UPI003CE81181
MKNKKIYIISIFLITSIVFNIFQFNKHIRLVQELETTKSNIDNTYEYLDSITVKSFENKVRDGENLCVYIGRAGCGDCNIFDPILRSTVEKYNIISTFKYINVQKYRSEDLDRWEQFKSKYGFTQTPALLIISKGKIVDMIEWNDSGLSQKRLVNWLEKNKLISMK